MEQTPSGEGFCFLMYSRRLGGCLARSKHSKCSKIWLRNAKKCKEISNSPADVQFPTCLDVGLQLADSTSQPLIRTKLFEEYFALTHSQQAVPQLEALFSYHKTGKQRLESGAANLGSLYNLVGGKASPSPQPPPPTPKSLPPAERAITTLRPCLTRSLLPEQFDLCFNLNCKVGIPKPKFTLEGCMLANAYWKQALSSGWTVCRGPQQTWG